MSDETIIAKPEDLTIQKPQKRRACLVQYNGPNIGKIFYVDEASVIIGRNASHPIYIQDASVSRNHVKLSKKGDDIWAEDLGSSNGTYINQVRINKNVPQILKDTNMLQIGNVVFKYCSSDNPDGLIQDRIYRMATIDNLTNIFNRQYLMDSLDYQIKYTQKTSAPLSIIYYDLDHFKKVNDTYGHNAGDIILKESTNLIKSIVRKDDIFARIGGEEFVIVLPNTTQAIAAELAERIRKQVGEFKFEIEVTQGSTKKKMNLKQTLSLGVSQFEPSMQSLKEFLDAADKKLYISKDSGRNKVTA